MDLDELKTEAIQHPLVRLFIMFKPTPYRLSPKRKGFAVVKADKRKKPLKSSVTTQKKSNAKAIHGEKGATP